MMRYRAWLSAIGILCLLCVFNLTVSTPKIVAAQTTTCEKSLEPRLLVGGLGRVTLGNSNNVRNEASTGELVGQIPNGDSFKVLAGPICADGGYWWRVQYSDFVGWSAEADDLNYWLEPYVPRFKRTIKDNIFHVTYDNFSFDVSTALADDVNYRFEIANWNSESAMAEHVCFGLRLDLPDHERPDNQLCVIKTGGMDNYVYNLQQILAETPTFDVPDGQTGIPIPFGGAAQLMQAQLNYISTDSLQGVSFVTRYARTDYTISGDSLAYNFSGLTQDGQFIIFLEYATNTTRLPVGPATNDQLSVVRENPLMYYKSIVDALNQGQASDFTPNLDTLAAIINSITIY